MYSVSDLRKAVENPGKAARELNRLFHTRFYSRDFNEKGIDIFEQDWDNLLILDACRYDMFEEHNNIEGRLISKISRGASTIEFLKGNFRDRKLHDTIYLTANPQLAWHEDEIDAEFFKMIDLWENNESWDDEYNTVTPEALSRKAEEIAEEYPDKRLIVHYMQPHYPFLPYKSEQTLDIALEDLFWNKIAEGELEISKEKIWSMYNDNLKRALDAVKPLIENTEGKTVITADHGNFVGEKSSPIPVTEWGHPIGIYDDILVKVPWLEIEASTRKEIKTETPENAEESDGEESEIKDKLKALGYTG